MGPKQAQSLLVRFDQGAMEINGSGVTLLTVSEQKSNQLMQFPAIPKILFCMGTVSFILHLHGIRCFENTEMREYRAYIII